MKDGKPLSRTLYDINNGNAADNRVRSKRYQPRDLASKRMKGEAMNITEVRIFPTKSKDGRLKAYATMTFDDWFVVRNVKVIQGNTSLFVAMPSRKVMDPCQKCGFKNVRGSAYCNDCGAPIKRQVNRDETPESKRQSEHMDIAHPIKQECRIYIQDKVLEAYNKEMERKEKEGDSYRPVSVDDLDEMPASEPRTPEDTPGTPEKIEPSTEEGSDIEL